MITTFEQALLSLEDVYLNTLRSEQSSMQAKTTAYTKMDHETLIKTACYLSID